MQIYQAFPTKNCRAWQLLTGRGRVHIQRLHEDEDFTKNEHGDVLLTCLWLQNRLWHLALTHGLLAFSNHCPILRLDFAVKLAEQTLEVCKSFRISSFEGHGQGLVSSLFTLSSHMLNPIG